MARRNCPTAPFSGSSPAANSTTTPHRHDVHIEPPECAGISDSVAWRESAEARPATLSSLKVDLVYVVKRITNGSIDVKVAACKYCACVEELLEDREGPFIQLCRRILKLLGRSVGETRAKQLQNWQPIPSAP